jgi:membrane protein required for colicin V production
MAHDMVWVDWAIVIVLVLSAFGGLAQGFLRSACSLLGLLFGLAIAAWNYARVAALFIYLVRIEAIADVVAFLLIAFVVMGIAGLAGTLLSKTIDKMGLGCVDRLAGAAFGLLQGALLVTLCILVTVAFFPSARWLTQASLPRLFFGACRLSTEMSPAELAERVRTGLRMLERESPEWLHPGNHGF